MKRILPCLVGFLISVSVFSQSKEYAEAATACLEKSGTLAYYESVFNTCFKQMQDQYANLEIPSETWAELKAVKPKEMQAVNTKLVSAYSDYFTLEDVKNMNSLYSSKAGQTMISNPNGLSKKDKKEIDKFYKTETGKKIVNSQSGMQEQMQVISDFWCGQMYKDVNTALEAKGYSIR